MSKESDKRQLNSLEKLTEEIAQTVRLTDREKRERLRAERRERYKTAFFVVFCVFVALGGLSPSGWSPSPEAPYGFLFGAPLSFWAAFGGGIIVAGMYLYYTRPEQMVAKELAGFGLWWKRYRSGALSAAVAVLLGVQYVRFWLRSAVVLAGLLAFLVFVLWAANKL